MGSADYNCMQVEVADGVARVTFDNPPINVMDLAMFGELDRLGQELETDDTVRVVVFDSADTDFFIAHADVNLILRLPTGGEPPDAPGLAHVVFDRFRTMPKVTIAKIHGICRGGGSEFVLSLDMRFAALESAVLGQPEVALGLVPGGGATERLPRLVGRSRALEVVLGAADFSADLAERYGYVNRALPAEELDAFVDGLVERIASFPPETIAMAKNSVLENETRVVEGLTVEARAFQHSVEMPETRARMEAFLAAGGQTREFEIKGAFGP